MKDNQNNKSKEVVLKKKRLKIHPKIKKIEEVLVKKEIKLNEYIIKK